MYPAQSPERCVLKAASSGTLGTFPHFMSNIPNMFVFFHKRRLLKNIRKMRSSPTLYHLPLTFL